MQYNIIHDVNVNFTKTLRSLTNYREILTNELYQHSKYPLAEELPCNFSQYIVPITEECELLKYQQHLLQYFQQPIQDHQSNLWTFQQQLLFKQQQFILRELLEIFIQNQAAHSTDHHRLGKYCIIHEDAYNSFKTHLGAKLSENYELESKIIELEEEKKKLKSKIRELGENQNTGLNIWEDIGKFFSNDNNKLSKTENNLQILQEKYQILQIDHQKKNNSDLKLKEEIKDLINDNERLRKETIKYQNIQIDHQKKNNNDLELSSREDLINLNKKLREEAIRYQIALGDATSFQLGSQDSNSSGQLSKDIRELHKSLDKLCGLKKRTNINKLGVEELMIKFGCSNTDKIHNKKNLISGLLSRHVIETIIEKTEDYFKQEPPKGLEVKLVKTTDQLLELTDSISTKRVGTDKVSKAISTKLRQQIYGVLGNRGFSDIVTDGVNKKPRFITTLQKDILDLMNRYRTIIDPKKLSEVDSLTGEIVKQVVSIFFFRLKVQEPVAEWKFFENKTKINTIMMEAPWDEDQLDNLYVDVCAFPLIGSGLCEVDKVDKNLKVIFPSQIITNK